MKVITEEILNAKIDQLTNYGEDELAERINDIFQNELQEIDTLLCKTHFEEIDGIHPLPDK